MNVFIALLIIFVHWIADFCLQTDKQAKNKSSNMFYLLEHTLTYTFVWTTFIFFYLALQGTSLWLTLIGVLIFSSITFICHTITDAVTSRINTYLWNKGDVHNFFVCVGFDQFLHYVQLFLTFKLISL